MPTLKKPNKGVSDQARHNAKVRASAAEIGRIPACKDPERRDACKDSIEQFALTYFSTLCSRPFTKDEREAVACLEASIKDCGTFAVSWPRGKGKTTISLIAAIWAVVYSWRRFIGMVAATGPAAGRLIAMFKYQFENNDLLRDDFPEICYPIRHLEGKAQRCASQTYQGHKTNISWKSNMIKFHTWPENSAAGAMVVAGGITAGIRGLLSEEGYRPDLFLIDDPQTRESAKSGQQTTDREDIIKGDILGSSGHDRRVAAVMNITYITQGDLTDRCIDRERHPEWQGIKTRLVERWPDNQKLWDEYARLWRYDCQEGTQYATRYYKQNRNKMDKGAQLDDDCLYDDKNEVSAIQHAYNLYLLHGEKVFNAEYQGEPGAEDDSGVYTIERSTVLRKLNGLQRGERCPNESYLTAGIDINYYALSWAVTSVQSNLAAYVADYNWYPGGNDVLWSQAKNLPLADAIYNGLYELIKALGAKYPDLTAVAIDGNYETETVYKAVETLDKMFPMKLIVSRGWSGEHYNDPNEKLNKPKGFRRAGTRCFEVKNPKGLTLHFDSHYWHQHLQMGFFQNPGADNSISLFGDRPDRHNIVASHIVADRLVRIEERNGRQKQIWEQDDKNDFGDALCMAISAASVESGNEHKQERKKLSDYRNKANGGRS